MVKIWRLGLKQSKRRNLAIEIPLVLYHGKDKWALDKRFASLFEGPADALSCCIPDFEFILYDLSQYTDDQIRGTIMARVTMLLLKHIFEQDAADKLPAIFMLLAVSIKFGNGEDCQTIITKIKTIQDINRLKALKGRILSANSVPELMQSMDS